MCSWSCTMYALGTKSVIIATLLAPSAPGVSAIDCRVTMVCVVDECGSTAASAAVTCTSSLSVATTISTGTSSTVPELRSSSRSAVARPLARTRKMYEPIGTATKEKTPFASVGTLRSHCDVFDCKDTAAPDTGRPCASRTFPRTVPKIVASALPARTNNVRASTGVARGKNICSMAPRRAHKGIMSLPIDGVSVLGPQGRYASSCPWRHCPRALSSRPGGQHLSREVAASPAEGSARSDARPPAM